MSELELAKLRSACCSGITGDTSYTEPTCTLDVATGVQNTEPEVCADGVCLVNWKPDKSKVAWR